MKLFKNHKVRVEKVKDFAGKNKVFVITMIVAAIFLFFNFVVQPAQKSQFEQEIAITEEIEDEAAASVESWRFYFIDVIILVAGGGFCLVMILRQRRKTREELK